MKKISYLSLFLSFFYSLNTLASLENLGNPLKNLYRGARLFKGEEDFKTLKKLGVTHIINLESQKDDEKLCSKYKISCHHQGSILIPWVESLMGVNTAIVEAYWKVTELLKEGKKVYVHCHWGSDRTGLLIGALRIAQMKKSLGDKPIPGAHIQALLAELSYHKHHIKLFPGVKFKIRWWAKKAPLWLFEKPKGI